MALVRLNTRSLPDSAVTTAKVADNAVTTTKLFADNLGRRNLIINGAMKVAQRGTSGSGVQGYPACDRFQYNLVGTVGASTVTQNTVTDLPSFTKSLKIDVTTADASLAVNDRLTLVYKIEGQDLQQVAKGTSSAKELTLSFYIKATKTGTQIVELFDHDNTRHCAKSVTINSSNTWEFKTITYPADTTGAFDNDNAQSLSIFFGIAVGTNFTSGTLATAWAANDNTNRFVGQVNHFDSTSNNFEITGLQLEVGDSATEFEHRSFAEELPLCQRYFERIESADGSRGVSSYVLGGGVWYTTTQVLASLQYNVTKRVSPTISVSGAGALKAYGNGYARTANDTTCFDQIEEKTARVNIGAWSGGASGTAGYGTLVQMVQGNGVNIDAEL